MKGRRRNLTRDEKTAVAYWCDPEPHATYRGTLTKKEAVELKKLVPFLPIGMHMVFASILTCIGVAVVMLVMFGLQMSDHDSGFGFIASFVGIPASYVYMIVTLRNDWDKENPA